MTRPVWRIGAELVPVFLVLACLGGSMALVILTHRHYAELKRSASAPKKAPPLAVVAVQPSVVVPPTVAPSQPPTKDPTPEILARLAAEAGEQSRAAEESDRQLAGLERARQTAQASAARWRTREMLVRAQANTLESKAIELETEAETLALERDVLARLRDDSKAEMLKVRARAGSSFAVLPYRGPNGTWQRPIAIECHDGMATIQPNGPSFNLLELSELTGYRSNPFIAAVAHQILRAQDGQTPDGAPSVPYILFAVRPDGIRPYYEARGRLEPLGIAFGYELVEQDQQIDYPDLGDLAEWDDATTARAATADASVWPARPPTQTGRDSNSPMIWPTTSPGGSRGLAGNSLSPLERPHAGPGAGGFGRSFAFDDDDDGGGDASATAPATGSVPVPDGRVEIVPRGGYARLGTPSLPSSRWVKPNDPRLSVTPPAPARLGQLEGQTPATGLEDKASSLLASSAETPAPTGSSWQPGVRATTASPSSPISPTSSASPSSSRASNDEDMRPPPPPLPATSSPSEATGNVASFDGFPQPSTIEPKRTSSSESTSMSGTGSPGSSRAGVPFPGLSNGSHSQSDELPSIPSDELKRIPERVIELVVVCGPKGVTIQPGGYRISSENLKAGDGYLVSQLRELVNLRRKAEPRFFWYPRLRFLVEPGGEDTYWEVRRQTVLAGTGWPVSLQVADAGALNVLKQERK